MKSKTIHSENKEALSIIAPAEQSVTEYEFKILPSANRKRAELIKLAEPIKDITTQAKAEKAAAVVSRIKGLLNLVEKSRKEVKAPVLALGRRIDAVADNYRGSLEEHRNRLEEGIDALEQKKAEEARIAEQARLAEIERVAEQARKRLEAVKREETKERIREQAAAKISAIVEDHAEPEATKGVKTREVWDFDVLSIDELYLSRADFCEAPSPKRSAILQAINQADGAITIPGLRIYKKTTTNIRAS